MLIVASVAVFAVAGLAVAVFCCCCVCSFTRLLLQFADGLSRFCCFLVLGVLIPLLRLLLALFLLCVVLAVVAVRVSMITVTMFRIVLAAALFVVCRLLSGVNCWLLIV